MFGTYCRNVKAWGGVCLQTTVEHVKFVPITHVHTRCLKEMRGKCKISIQHCEHLTWIITVALGALDVLATQYSVCVCSSHALTSDVTIKETARAAEFFLSDGLIITGAATGEQADPGELRGTAAMHSAVGVKSLSESYL